MENELVTCLFCEDFFTDHEQWFDHLEIVHEEEYEWAEIVSEFVGFFDEQIELGVDHDTIRQMIREAGDESDSIVTEKIIELFNDYVGRVRPQTRD